MSPCPPAFKRRKFQSSKRNSGKLDIASLLPNMANYMIQTLAGSGEDDPVPNMFAKFSVPQPVGVGSLCSGSGRGELTMHSLMRTMGQTCYTSFVCECVPWKQRFLKVNVLTDPESCLFADCVAMGKGKDAGHCVVHNKQCSAIKRPTHILKSGFSCKSFSRLNRDIAKNIDNGPT